MIFAGNSKLNLTMVIKLLGLLLLLEAVFMLPPLLTSILYEEYATARSFAYAVAITATCGIIAFIRPIHNRYMGKREGFLLTALTWLIFSIFGIIPFMLQPCGMSFADAFFETMSGITTTGASVIESVEAQTHGILMWRAMTHFIGGMGIILFTLAVFPMLNKQSGLQMFNAEVSGLNHEKIRPRVSHTAKTLWTIYLVLNIVLIFLLWLGPMSMFDAVCQGVSAIATGGFTTHNGSINAFHSDYVKIVMTAFMFISGCSFSLIYQVVKGDLKNLAKNDVLKWYILIALSSMSVIFLFEWFSSNETIGRLLVDVPFQTISAITSSGFNATDINLWHHSSIIVVIMLMALGACAGSTTGGVKIDRLVLLWKSLRAELHKILYPNRIAAIRINGKIFSNEMVTKALAFLTIFVITLFIGCVVLSLSGISIFDSFFASLSCLSNNGLGYGLTGTSFEELSGVAKFTLSLMMMVGRLEFFAVIILFTKSFWRK